MYLQGIGKRLLDAAELYLVDVQAFGCFHALWMFLGLDAEVELKDDEAVVCLVLGATHTALGDDEGLVCLALGATHSPLR